MRWRHVGGAWRAASVKGRGRWCFSVLTGLLALLAMTHDNLPVACAAIALPWLLVAIHEGGHVIASRVCGSPTTTRVWPFFGFTTCEGFYEARARDQALVAVAGPLAGASAALLAGAGLEIYVSSHVAPWEVVTWLRLILRLALVDHVLNLVPIRPLDGSYLLLAARRMLASTRRARPRTASAPVLPDTLTCVTANEPAGLALAGLVAGALDSPRCGRGHPGVFPRGRAAMAQERQLPGPDVRVLAGTMNLAADELQLLPCAA